MATANPYQSPTCPSELGGLETLQHADWPAATWPCCLKEVTFWDSFVQYTPFRYKCPRCGLAFRAHTPHMTAIFAGICTGGGLFLFVVIASGVLAIAFNKEVQFLVTLGTSVPPLIAIRVALERWMHKYIIRHGRFGPNHRCLTPSAPELWIEGYPLSRPSHH